LLSITEDARANLASVNQRLDMLRTDRVMTIFADDRDRFCVCNPGVICMHDFLFGVVVTDALSRQMFSSLLLFGRSSAPCWLPPSRGEREDV